MSIEKRSNDFILMLCIAVIVFLCAVSHGRAAGLTPDVFSLTWSRTGVTQTVFAPTNFLMGTSYLLQSNAVQNAIGAPQDLTGLGGFVTVGATESNIAYSITIDNTNGIFDCAITTPVWKAYSGELCSMQLTLTNNSGTIVTFKGLQQFGIQRGLH